LHLRRKLLVAAALSPAMPWLAGAQSKPARIGYLRPSRSSQSRIRFEAFKQALRDIGYVEGKTIVIEERSAEGKRERLSGLAGDLVRLNVDVIVADGGTPTIMAAKNATATIPIVFPTVSDPVALGFAKTLSRPGGNLTGLSLQSAETESKRVDLVRQILPHAKRFGYLVNPSNPSAAPTLKQVRVAAAKAALSVDIVEARSPAEIDAAFATMREKRDDSVILHSDQMLNENASRIAVLSAKLSIPAIAASSEIAERGALASYGPERLEMLRQAAGLVDKILKGAAPAELPIEQPRKFELVINHATAKALGITVPQAVLLRADRVIE
jgi:putative tryptophan/tyrosine transport system substrate-binding protein